MGRLPPTAGPSMRGSVRPVDRSRANEERSWATSTTSANVPSDPPSWSTSARIDSVERERCLPRKEGMAQNPQLRSQPSATLIYDHGADECGRGRLRRSKSGMVAAGAGLEPKVTGVLPDGGFDGAEARSDAPKGATRSISGRASASSSP